MTEGVKGLTNLVDLAFALNDPSVLKRVLRLKCPAVWPAVINETVLYLRVLEREFAK